MAGPLKLVKLTLKGFTSIAEASIDFTDINVMIGANGAGKSNLIAFFRMLREMMAPPTGNLQRFVAASGGAAALLHDGPKQTSVMSAVVTIANGKLPEESGGNIFSEYTFNLSHSSGDAMYFSMERCRVYGVTAEQETKKEFGSGHRESLLRDNVTQILPKVDGVISDLNRGAQDEKIDGKLNKKVIDFLLQFAVILSLKSISEYQFSDTSANARVMHRQRADDNHTLKHDGANLAPILLKFRENHPKHYRRIVETVRQIAPFFDDFVLESDGKTVLLQWREMDSDLVFSADQASDGTLRAMMLITLLLQPKESLPALLILDEPELGLHPYAITIIGELIHTVSQHSQVLIATQSPMMLDQFSAADVIVVDRDGRRSNFRRLDEEKLAQWLEDYSLGDLWGRNVLGGRPREGGGA